jgi:hypothetical protein
MVAKNPKAWIKNPAGVGIPVLVIIGMVEPRSPWTIRKVSGLAKIKKTRVLYKLYLTLRRNRFIENSVVGLVSFSVI